MATLIDEKGLQHYANKMVKAENRKVGTKSLPTALTEIDAMIDSMKGKFEQAYGDALEGEFTNNSNLISVGAGEEGDRSNTVEEGFLGIDSIKGASIVNRLNLTDDKIATPIRVNLSQMNISPNTEYQLIQDNNNIRAAFKQPKYEEISIKGSGESISKTLDLNEPINILEVRGNSLDTNLFYLNCPRYSLQGSSNLKIKEGIEGFDSDTKGFKVTNEGGAFSFRFGDVIPCSGTYSVSAYIKVNSGGKGSVGVDINDSYSNKRFNLIQGKWVYCCFDGIATDRFDNIYNFLDFNFGGFSGAVDVDIYKIKINKGNKAEAWTPNVREDVKNTIVGFGERTYNIVNPYSDWRPNWYFSGGKIFLDSGYLYTNFVVKVEPNKKYKVSYDWVHPSKDRMRNDVLLFSEEPRLHKLGRSATVQDVITSDRRRTFSFSTAQDTKYVFLYLGWGDKGSNKTLEEVIKNFAIEELSEDRKELYSVKVLSRGKNLANIREMAAPNPEAAKIRVESDKIYLEGHGVQHIHSPRLQNINVSEFSKVTLSMNLLAGSGNCYVEIVDSIRKKTLYISYDYRGNDVTLDVSDVDFVNIYVSKHFSERANITIEKFMLEAGETKTAYEPWTGYENSFILKEPLHKIGPKSDRIYWDNSKQKYCVEQYIDKMVFDGSQRLTEYADVPEYNIRGFYYSAPETNLWYENRGMNDYIHGQRTVNLPGIIAEEILGLNYSVGYTKFTIPRSYIKTNIQDYLRENPITVYRVLQKPRIIELERNFKTILRPQKEKLSICGGATNKTLFSSQIKAEIPVVKTYTGRKGLLTTPENLDNLYLEITGGRECHNPILTESTFAKCAPLRDLANNKFFSVGNTLDRVNVFNFKSDYTTLYLYNGDKTVRNDGSGHWGTLTPVIEGNKYMIENPKGNLFTWGFLAEDKREIIASGDGKVTSPAPVGAKYLLCYLKSTAFDTSQDNGIEISYQDNKSSNLSLLTASKSLNIANDILNLEEWNKKDSSVIIPYKEEEIIKGITLVAAPERSYSYADAAFIKTPMNRDKPYTLSFEKKTSASTRLWIGFYSLSGNYNTVVGYETENTKGNFKKYSYTFYPSHYTEGGQVYLSFWNYADSSTGIQSEITLKNIKLEAGEKSSEWSPAEQYTDSKEVPLEEPLRGINEIIYDSIEGDKVIKRCAEIVMDGSYLAHITPDDYVNDFSCAALLNLKSQDKKFKRGSGAVKCSALATYPSSKSIWMNTSKFDGISSVHSSWDFAIRISNAKTGISKTDSVDKQKEKMRNYLNENPITVIYELATPEMIALDSKITLLTNKEECLIINNSLVQGIETTHSVALNKPGQILKNIEELTILRDRVEKLEANYDQLALEQAHQLALTKQSIELDYEI